MSFLDGVIQSNSNLEQEKTLAYSETLGGLPNQKCFTGSMTWILSPFRSRPAGFGPF